MLMLGSIHSPLGGNRINGNTESNSHNTSSNGIRGDGGGFWIGGRESGFEDEEHQPLCRASSSDSTGDTRQTGGVSYGSAGNKGVRWASNALCVSVVTGCCAGTPRTTWDPWAP